MALEGEKPAHLGRSPRRLCIFKWGVYGTGRKSEETKYEIHCLQNPLLLRMEEAHSAFSLYDMYVWKLYPQMLLYQLVPIFKYNSYWRFMDYADT